MGLEDPGPGNGVFQRRFSLSLQVVGAESELIPAPPGPRNCGQSPAIVGLARLTSNTPRKQARTFIGCLWVSCTTFANAYMRPRSSHSRLPLRFQPLAHIRRRSYR